MEPQFIEKLNFWEHQEQWASLYTYLATGSIGILREPGESFGYLRLRFKIAGKKGTQFVICRSDFDPDPFNNSYQIILSMQITALSKTNRAKKILVVEDQGEISLALEMILSERNFKLDHVNNLLDADAYLETHKPSVILLDNKLPDGFGVDFISYVKKKHPEVKIIMISGFSTARDVAMENGADFFLDKPFSLDSVNDAIDRVLDK